MAKKPATKPPKKPQKFNWNPKRTKAAQLLSTGTYTHKKVAEIVGVRQDTISEWKTYKEFLQEIDRLTLENELAMRAGLKREIMLGIHIKRKNIEDDKSSHLDYVKTMLENVDDDEALDELQEFIESMKTSTGRS